MRYSLIVNRITDNIDDNVKRILEYIDESKNNGAEFVLFPECALTGLQNNDIEEHDLKLGIKENSKHIRLICESCICYFKKGPKFATYSPEALNTFGGERSDLSNGQILDSKTQARRNVNS